MHKFQMKTGGCKLVHNKINFKMSEANKSLPTILVEDTSKIEEEPNTDDETKKEARSQSSTLRRQSKFTKGAARPKLLVSKHSSSNNSMHPCGSWQDLSTMLHKSLSAPSRENLSTIPTQSLRPANPSKKNVNQKLYSDNTSGVGSGRSSNGDIDATKDKERFKRRESYQKVVNLKFPSRVRLLARPKHKTITETTSLDITSQLSRFSSYSNLLKIF